MSNEVKRPNGLDSYGERTEQAAEHLAFLHQMRDAPVVPGVNDHLGHPVLDAVEYVDAAASALECAGWSPLACARLRNVVNLLMETNAARIAAEGRLVVLETFRHHAAPVRDNA